MNSLLEECIDLKIGCTVGENIVSVIAFCDDLFLMSPTKQKMDSLLKIVYKYALKWKIRFNVNKCVNLTLYPPNNKSKKTSTLHLNGVQLTKKLSIIHLGLPLGPHLFIKDYWKEKMKSTVRSQILS